MNSPTINFDFRYVRLCDLDILREKMTKIANVIATHIFFQQNYYRICHMIEGLTIC